MSFLEKTSWFLANASSSVALMITVFFWFFLYDGENSYGNIFVHLLNSIRYLHICQEHPFFLKGLQIVDAHDLFP